MIYPEIQQNRHFHAVCERQEAAEGMPVLQFKCIKRIWNRAGNYDLLYSEDSILLRENSLDLFGINEFSKSHDICGHTERTVTFFGYIQNALKRSAHKFFQHFINLITVPGQFLYILNPLEVRNNDAAAVGKNIRNQCNASFSSIASASSVVGPLAASTI